MVEVKLKGQGNEGDFLTQFKRNCGAHCINPENEKSYLENFRLGIQSTKPLS